MSVRRLMRLMGSGGVAREIGVTPQTVGSLVRRGLLRPAATSDSGFHLFAREEVDRLKTAWRKPIRYHAQSPEAP